MGALRGWDPSRQRRVAAMFLYGHTSSLDQYVYFARLPSELFDYALREAPTGTMPSCR
jgi:hypothetical protein